MIVTLKVLSNVQTKPNKEGKSKIIKRDLQSLRQFETTNITVEQYISNKGKISKKWCYIREGDNYYKMNHKFEEIEALTKPIIVEGFKKW